MDISLIAKDKYQTIEEPNTQIYCFLDKQRELFSKVEY
jgi:hypothetical protein